MVGICSFGLPSCRCRVGKLIDSLSHSSKFSKLFGPRKLNPTMQYLLHVGPQGIVRVWPRALSEETNYCSFMVSMTTSSVQVVRLVLDKYDAIEDPRRFYISEVQLSKGGARRKRAIPQYSSVPIRP